MRRWNVCRGVDKWEEMAHLGYLMKLNLGQFNGQGRHQESKIHHVSCSQTITFYNLTNYHIIT